MVRIIDSFEKIITMAKPLYLLCLWICISVAHAASVNNERPFANNMTSPESFGIQQPRLPEVEPSAPPETPKFSLPQLEPPSENDHQLSTMPEIRLQKINLIGNTIFTDTQLSAILSPYEGRVVSTEILQNIRLQLSQYYIDRGYINSGAVIPDQTVKKGVIQIQIIEGALNNIHITGNHWLHTDYIKQRIELGVTSPLNTQPIQQRLLLLKQDPLFDQISAVLKPGLHRGESELGIQIQESRPYQMGLLMSNDRSPNIGSESAQIWAIHRNVTGFGDRLYAHYNLTEGLNHAALSYSMPLNAYDTRLILSFNHSDSDLIEPISNVSVENEPEIASQSEMYEVSIKHPIYRTPEQTLSLTLGFEYRNSQTFLGGKGFGFSEGVPDNGKSKISVVRFSQDWLDRDQNQVVAIRSRLSVGIDAFGSTTRGKNPNGTFVSWLGQFQWVRRLPLFNSQMIVRADMQFSSEPLLPLEKFSVGGQHSVRGYRENQWVRDHGMSASWEWRIPVFRLPIPLLSEYPDEGQVQFASFMDFGWSENIRSSSPDPDTLSSAGLGLRWNPSRKIHSQIYWAIPFRKIQNNRHNLQDSGIHFRIAMDFL